MISKITNIITKEIHTTKNFQDLAGYFVNNKGTVLLLSGGEHESARYNIISIEPWLEISSKGSDIFITVQGETTILHGNPFNILKEITNKYKKMYGEILANVEDSHLFPISAGLFGYLSYDMKDHIEFLNRTTVDDLDLPELYMIIPGLIFVEDRITGKQYIQIIELDNADSKQTEYYMKLLEAAEMAPIIKNDFTISNNGFESNFNRDEYKESISDIINYIKEGDIYQVNMSQRFTSDFEGNPYTLFKELFEENPAAFFSYLNCGDHQVISTSPERFILQEGTRVEAKPIKGTRPRGKTAREDKVLKEELQNSPKDDAELSMIVDLLRNDLGKVCKGGSVKVLKHKFLETYKNVFHLVSTIEGFIEENKDSIDLLKAAFPGGSITGCPKIRSMEIIDEKEPFRRHIYTGSIGYIGFNNRMDFSIVIRTATITKGKILFSVGGGIVYDSDPADEFDETLHKAGSLMKVMNRHKDVNSRSKKTNSGISGTLSEGIYCWNNGKFLQEKNSTISPMSQGYQYGKGVFETIKVEQGRIEHLKKHLGRLEKGCKNILDRKLPELDWKGIVELLIIKNNLGEKSSVLKIIISEGKNGLFEDLTINVTCRIYNKRAVIIERGKLHLGIFPNIRENFLAEYKTLNYLFYLKAGEWAKKNGFDEALILNADGSVSETNTGNILLIQNNVVTIPESNYRLAGIMETVLIDNYKKQNYTIIRKKIMPEDLLKKDKVLVTNSLIGAVEGKLQINN
jgi:para-aminobenzoate synthetase component I